ncbi:D-2-hydroxyacid dehydrogenase [Nocardioides flavus (ex Wang et al. 2016)]|uniref:D-2-hydroxyacid dehydrogenase n=1 Tax=Nocardioides flavus (ex Wang et al. 2016) TaxID=2058780 RepID=A0ABQ3HDE3_9ACTN|nr:FAD-binding oxidoreductase [Nocardioides flavus (ex Wang et al. 2016)]GHE15162.1 D-2-hydroxyacid dehydrogenase [Nocardioides flavus (ex Wang et al. 2016)]
MTDLLARLRTAVGDTHVLTEPADVAPYVVDWTGTHEGRALAVVRPGSTAEVAEVVRACAETRTPIVPQGGNTGLVGGGVPDPSGTAVVLSLGRMRSVREVDPVAGTITVDAGVVLADVQAAAEQAGRLFPMSLGSEGSCTIGGNLATNAGGTAVLRYGMTRELVLGLEVVLPDGRVWDGLRGLRKDNTGYDLTQLFVGSEGTLGVITGAILRLFPATPRHATAWVAVPSVAAAVSLLGIAQQHGGVHLSTFEIANRQALDLVLAHLPGAVDPLSEPSDWYVLVELAGSPSDDGLDPTLEELLGEAVEDGTATDAAIAGSPAQRSALWALREGISEVQKVEGATLKHDVTLPIADLAAWTDAMGPRLQEILPGVRPVTYGHVGDGNLHYNLNAPVGRDDDLRAAARELTAAIYDAVAATQGSISAEHGLGRTKAVAAASYKSDVEVDLMRAVKQALDPAGLMNPGAVVPVAEVGA